MGLTQHETREAMNGLLQLVWKRIKAAQQVEEPSYWIAQAQGSAEQLAHLAFSLHPELRGHQSSVDMVEQYAARVGTATSVEIGELILRNAADYLYSRQNGATWEHADPGDAKAVDALDDYRTVLANGNDLARIEDEVGNVDLCEIEPAPSTRVVRVLERLTTGHNEPEKPIQYEWADTDYPF